MPSVGITRPKNTSIFIYRIIVASSRLAEHQEFTLPSVKSAYNCNNIVSFRRLSICKRSCVLPSIYLFMRFTQLIVWREVQLSACTWLCHYTLCTASLQITDLCMLTQSQEYNLGFLPQIPYIPCMIKDVFHSSIFLI